MAAKIHTVKKRSSSERRRGAAAQAGGGVLAGACAGAEVLFMVGGLLDMAGAALISKERQADEAGDVGVVEGAADALAVEARGADEDAAG